MKKIFLMLILIRVVNPAFAGQSVEVTVTNKGFEPSKISAKAGEPITLNITRKAKITCAKKITVPSMNIEKELPFNKTVAVAITPSKKGEIKFGCAMKQMLGGVIIVE
ncbi:MAG: cupredoxin domain-containing protein [Bdellovibrionales bacterium]|nr:cupredoxin domain-containing protein [Bdellovibrionales bacterium]